MQVQFFTIYIYLYIFGQFSNIYRLFKSNNVRYKTTLTKYNTQIYDIKECPKHKNILHWCFFPALEKDQYIWFLFDLAL